MTDGSGGSGGGGGGGGGGRGPATARGRGAVAASMIGGLLLGGYFASDTAAGTAGGATPATDFLVNAVILVPAFWFPALRIAAPGDVLRSWRPLGVWLLAWTLAWDLASAAAGGRDLFQEWWLVYPAGVGVLAGLLALHGWVVDRVGADGGPDRGAGGASGPGPGPGA